MDRLLYLRLHLLHQLRRRRHPVKYVDPRHLANVVGLEGLEVPCIDKTPFPCIYKTCFAVGLRRPVGDCKLCSPATLYICFNSTPLVVIGCERYECREPVHGVTMLVKLIPLEEVLVAFPSTL